MTSDSEDEDEENEEEGSESVSDPFASIRNLRSTIASLPTLDVQNLVAPEVIRALSNPISPELQKALTQPIIDPEVLAQLQQPTIDEDLLKAIQEPAIDTETVQALQQPPIDEATLKALSEPAIDPDLVSTLKSLNNPAILRAYEAAAATEQITEEGVEEIKEKDIKEDTEPPEKGGFLSTFFNVAAYNLLQRSDELPEESVTHLNEILRAESVRSKSDAFRNFVESAKGIAAGMIVSVMVMSYHLTWGLFFPSETDEEESEDESEEEEEEEEEEEDDTE
jgi:hypothetical protein